MELESYFVEGVLLVVPVALLMRFESWLEAVFKRPTCGPVAVGFCFERRPPTLCDKADNF